MTTEREPAVMSLTAYATVRAGLEDGLGLSELCALVGLPAGSWPDADRGWQASLLADLEQGGSLAAELELAMGRAQLGWHRPLAPLDQELRAWLDFVRALERALEPDRVLDERGMRQADLRRLETIWRERLAADAGLRNAAVAILAEPAGALPDMRSTPAACRQGGGHD